MIQVRELTKSFARHTAVRGIDFDVARGEIVGFLGPNGAGKTTTLRMLTGYLPPTSGSARVAGFDIFRQSLEARRCIGYMPENVPLYDDMRVREYLKYRASLKGLSNRDGRRRVNEVIDICGLDWARRKMIKVLSKGYRQRVGLADALVHEPQLLILDEPTNGLDPNQIRQIRDLIFDLKKRGITVFLCSHLLEQVQEVCDRVGIIHRGRMVKEGPLDELLAVGDQTEIILRGASPELLEKIRALVSSDSGAELLRAGRPRTTLERRFLQETADRRKP